MNNDLPRGWISTTLDQIFEPRSSRVSPSDFPESPYVGLEHVEAHTNKLLATVLAATMSSSAARFFNGDVLYGRMRPYLNKVVSPLFDGLASAEFIVFPTTTGVDNKFVLWRLSASDFVEFACSQYEGDRPRVKFDQLSKFELHLPPAAEQSRIVEKLEELLSDLDAGVAELKAAQKKLAQYRQSLLKAAVEGALMRRDQAYPQKPLGELVISIGQGWSPKCENSASNDENVWAVIKTTAIQSLKFDGRYNKVLPEALSPREHLELQQGDLLMTRAGPRSRVGVACLVKQTRKRLILCDKAYRIRVDTAQVNPAFLELVLNAPHMVNMIDSLKTGISDSGLNLTQDRFFTLMIPTPSLGEQAEIIESVERAMDELDAQDGYIEHTLKQSTAQRKNILKAAFSGQLVPQDPDDEPASVLLERIRAERAEREKQPKIRKARTAREFA